MGTSMTSEWGRMPSCISEVIYDQRQLATAPLTKKPRPYIGLGGVGVLRDAGKFGGRGRASRWWVGIGESGCRL
jgi:hypothetical protein